MFYSSSSCSFYVSFFHSFNNVLQKAVLMQDVANPVGLEYMQYSSHVKLFCILFYIYILLKIFKIKVIYLFLNDKLFHF